MTEHFLGTATDLVVIVAYFAGILLFGSFFARYTKTTTDFFFAGRRFAWWLVAISGVATTVGSYSFIKYSEAAYSYGLASTQTYTNDWMWMPLLILGWIPIVYYNRIQSIPEYFDRRFGKSTRLLYTTLLMLYLLGYVGINLYTLGVAVHALAPSIEVLPAAAVVACFTALYVTAGGQASVIMTDLAQAILMLAAGVFLFIGGVYQLGGLSALWEGIPAESRHSLGEFAGKPSISFIKIFWQDGVANSFAFWFVNQGMVQRFLAAKSAREARKAVLFNALFLMPLAAFAVCNAGIVGRAMTHAGILPEETKAADIFVVVSNLIAVPGVFGLIMAALVAALMSTADTLVNAISAIAINDIWRPYLMPGRSDRFYLNLARVHCIGVMALGLALVPIYIGFATIYDAHGAFTAAVTPPLVVALLLAIIWPRFNRTGAMAVLTVGAGLVGVSLFFPEVITPFAHGVVSEIGEDNPPYKRFQYMRACYGMVVCLGVGILGTWIGRNWLGDRGEGAPALSITSARALMREFKGSEPNLDRGESVVLPLSVSESEGDRVVLPVEAARRMNARVGDLIYMADERSWLGGVKSAHGRVAAVDGDQLLVPRNLIENGRLDPNRKVRVELVM